MTSLIRISDADKHSTTIHAFTDVTCSNSQVLPHPGKHSLTCACRLSATLRVLNLKALRRRSSESTYTVSF